MALGAKLGEIRHGMTNRRISCRVYEARLAAAHRLTPDHVSDEEPRPSPPPEHGWFTLAEITRLPLAASARKTIESLLETPL